MNNIQRECVTRFSTSIFFHDFNPSRSLINRLKYIFEFSNSVSILPRYSITKFKKFDSAVCITPRSRYFSLNGPAAFCNPSSSPCQRSQTQFSIMYLYLICEKPNKNIYFFKLVLAIQKCFLQIFSYMIE